MNTKNMKNEDAVSPVIGVILMVVITVIIAAILAVFSFGIGGPDKTPQANLKFKAVDGAAADSFDISHEGGDPLILKDLSLTVKDVNTAAVIYNAQKLDTSSTFIDPVTAAYPVSGVLAPGQVITDAPAVAITAGQMLRVQVLNIPTGQMISDTQIVVQ